MHHLTLTSAAQLGLLQAHRLSKPKGSEEFYAAVEAEKVLSRDVKVVDAGNGTASMQIAREAPAEVDVEDGAFRYLERVLNAHVDAGDAFTGANAPLVVAALDALKDAKARKVEAPKDAPKLVDKKARKAEAS